MQQRKNVAEYHLAPTNSDQIHGAFFFAVPKFALAKGLKFCVLVDYGLNTVNSFATQVLVIRAGAKNKPTVPTELRHLTHTCKLSVVTMTIAPVDHYNFCHPHTAEPRQRTEADDTTLGVIISRLPQLISSVLVRRRHDAQ